MMKEQLEQRLTALKAEFEAGQKVLRELEEKQSNVRETVLRISGAIQVLEEELQKADDREGDQADRHLRPDSQSSNIISPDAPSPNATSSSSKIDALTDILDIESNSIGSNHTNGHPDPVAAHLNQGE